MREGFLYGVRMVIPNYEHNPVKIGYSKNPQMRALSYFGSGPFPCEWLGEWPAKGGKTAEAEAHHYCRNYRLSGEWFFPAPNILAFIERNVQKYLALLAKKEAEYADSIRRARTRKAWWLEQARCEAYADFDVVYEGMTARSVLCSECRAQKQAKRMREALGVQLRPLSEIRQAFDEFFGDPPIWGITEEEVAERLGVHVSKVQGWVTGGEIGSYNPGRTRRTLRCSREGVYEFLDRLEAL